MIESYIEPGSQKIGEHCYGKSITDPCLGWETASVCCTRSRTRWIKIPGGIAPGRQRNTGISIRRSGVLSG